MADRTVLVRLKADTSQYESAMRGAAGSMDGIGKAQDAAQKKADRWQAVGAASQVAGATIAAGLALATKAASDQEQALGGLDAVFKTSSAQMRQYAEDARDIGLSQSQYADGATRLGAVLGNLGVDQENLAGTTNGLMDSAADMAAQFGGSTQEAVDALAAAMRGEADPAERYGLALGATAVAAEQAAGGGSKAEAIIRLLNEQLAKSGTAGAAAREYDTAAASAQRMQADFDNAAAALGEALLPAMTKAADAASTLLGWFNALPGPVKTFVAVVSALAGGALIVAPRIMSMVDGVRQLRDHLNTAGESASAAGGKLSGFAATAGKIGAVATAAALAVPVVQELFDAVSKGLSPGSAGNADLLTQQLIRLGRDGSAEVGRLNTAWYGLGDAFKENASAWDQWGKQGPFNSRLNEAEGDITAIDTALAAMVSSGNADGAAAAVQAMVTATEQAGGSAEDVTGALPQYSTALEASAVAAENAAAATDGDTDAKNRNADATRGLTASLETYVALQLALSGSADALIGQQGRLADAVKEHGSAVRGHTKAAAANREAVRSEVSAVVALANARKEEAASGGDAEAGTKAYNKTIKNLIPDLYRSAEASGMNADQVAAYLSQLTGLPKRKITQILAQGAKQSKKDIDEHNKAANRVPGKKSTDVDAPGARQSKKDLDEHSAAANRVPRQKLTDIKATGTALAKQQIDNTRWAAEDAEGTYTITMRTIKVSGEAKASASGGLITGPGTATSDSIPAWLSDGEYVVRASAVDKYGVGFLDAVNGQRFASGGKVKKRKKKAKPPLTRRAVPGWVWEQLQKYGYDQEWAESNAPRLPGVKKWMGVGDVWRDKPTRKKDEKDDKYAERVKQWRQERKQTRQSFTDTIRRDQLDKKHTEAQAARDLVIEKAREKAEKRRADAQAKFNDAEQAHNTLLADKQSYIDRISESLRSNLDVLSAFDFTAHADAVKDLADAGKDVADARRELVAATGAERAEARAALAEAEKKQKEAEQAEQSSRHTPGNIIAAAQERARKAKEFTAGILDLKARGLGQSMIDQLAGMNPDQALDMIAAYRQMTGEQIGQMNAAAWTVAVSGQQLGEELGKQFDPLITAAAEALSAAQVQVDIAAAPVTVNVDGKALASALIEYRRRSGTVTV